MRTGRAFALRSMRWRSTRSAHRGNAPAETPALGGGEVRARQQPSGGRLRRAAVAHATVIFNIARPRRCHAALQPQELYKTQQYATAVYRSELSRGCKQLGYEMSAGTWTAEIRVTRASIWRRRVRGVRNHRNLAEQGRSGPEAAQIAAHKTREAKLDLTPEQVQAQHRAMAAEYGINHSGDRTSSATARVELQPEASQRVAQASVSYARERARSARPSSITDADARCAQHSMGARTSRRSRPSRAENRRA